jgi:hypothetical protein
VDDDVNSALAMEADLRVFSLEGCKPTLDSFQLALLVYHSIEVAELPLHLLDLPDSRHDIN